MEKLKGKRTLIWSDRWRMGALTRTELLNIAWVSLLIGMLYLMFHLLGNTVSNVESRSAFVWMISRWNDKISFGADYSHGYLIPFVSLWIVWYNREALRRAEKKTCIYGLYVIIAALIMHWLGAKMQQTRFSLLSLILLIWGIPFYFFGRQVAKLLIFPCAYLIFCVPLNFLDALSFPLQRLATTIAHAMLNGMGIECEKVGTQLLSPYFQLNVEAPCSGLRSLLAMTALTAVYAYFTQKTLFKKWLLFVLSIPLAVAGNIGRIISIALVAIVSGQKLGAGLYHDWAGYVLFTIAIGLMVATGKLLNANHKEMLAKWKKAFSSPS